MHHHHLLASLSLAGLAAVGLLPWPLALPLAAALALGGTALSVGVSRSVAKVPVTTGREAMLGDAVQVVGRVADRWQVRHRGETWSAVSPDALLPGEFGQITGYRGLVLEVVRQEPPGPAQPALYRLSEARRLTARALTDLHARMAALSEAAERRKAAARSALPAHEAEARVYLLQKQSLLAERSRLAAQAAALESDLARVTALEEELRAAARRATPSP